MPKKHVTIFSSIHYLKFHKHASFSKRFVFCWITSRSWILIRLGFRRVSFHINRLFPVKRFAFFASIVSWTKVGRALIEIDSKSLAQSQPWKLKPGNLKCRFPFLRERRKFPFISPRRCSHPLINELWFHCFSTKNYAIFPPAYCSKAVATFRLISSIRGRRT